MSNSFVAVSSARRPVWVAAVLALLIPVLGLAQKAPATKMQASVQNNKPATSGARTPTVPHTLMDARWGMAWGTVKLPAGWAFNGGVVHGGDSCFVMGDGPMWSAESADKSYGIALLPALKTGYTSDPNVLRQQQMAHCPLMNSTSAADYLTKYVLPNFHQNKIEIISVGSEPQFEQMAAQFRQQNARSEQIMNNQFSRTHFTVETARVLLHYQEAGRTLNEAASTVFSCMHSQMSMPPAPPLGILDCTAMITAIAHVPDDGTPFNNAWMDAHSKDPAPFEMIPSPEWQQRFQQQMQQKQRQMMQTHQQNMANQQAQFEAGQARHRQQQQMYDQYNAAQSARRGAMDKSNEAFLGYLSDTNTYMNPQTGQQYQLSNQYNNTYINQNGNVALQTDSANSPGVDWTLMIPKH